MGTITRRTNKSGEVKYTAQIRLRRQGRIVYQETQSFDFKQTARAWLLRRESELAAPGALERTQT
jgi:hypothetical protein